MLPLKVSGLAQFLLRASMKLFNKDNDFIIDLSSLRLAFKLPEGTICPRDAREGAKEKLSPHPVLVVVYFVTINFLTLLSPEFVFNE